MNELQKTPGVARPKQNYHPQNRKHDNVRVLHKPNDTTKTTVKSGVNTFPSKQTSFNQNSNPNSKNRGSRGSYQYGNSKGGHRPKADSPMPIK